MTASSTTHDKNGAVVEVGAVVRVLIIRDAVLARLPPEEVERVKTMQGATLSVYEIDGYGAAWVQKWWNVGSDEAISHSIALAPSEMELVATGRGE